VSVKVPSDIDVADRILWGLTARQLVILGVTCISCWGLYLPLARLPYLAAPMAGIVAAAGISVTFARPDGLMAERWLLEALRHVMTPRRRVLAPEGLPDVPPWAKTREPVAAMEMPLAGVTKAGVLELTTGVFSLACRASALNLTLRSESERVALVEGLGRFLNSVDSSLSFVVRAERSDVRDHIEAIEQSASGLPHPALEQAARSHAAYLSSLAERRDVLRREVYLLLTTRAEDEDDASVRLHARADEAGALLRGLGIRLTPLAGDEAARLVARACDPEGEPSSSLVALPNDVVAGAIT
jgi:hypothetical protein